MRGAAAAAARFWRKANEENLTGLSAMVAYNLLLSIFPLALVALFIAGRVLRSPEVQESVLRDLEQLFPSAAESTLSEAVRRLQQSSTTAGIVALVAAVWFASSFWGAVDTAFCRIYHRPCRSWVRQKLFALGMFAVVLLFIVASVAMPAIQSLLLTGADDLPFGLSDVPGLLYGATLVAGVLVLFAALCVAYRVVPRGSVPWRCVWPGAAVATVAMLAVDYAFPVYLQNVSTLRAGTTFVFVLIVLVWFYAMALILLVGAVVNELRFEAGTRRDMTERDEPERDVEEMEERAERLEEEIEEVREDWERKKRDPSVPGAAGNPERADEEVPPEADEPGG
jgi:membrane protein